MQVAGEQPLLRPSFRFFVSGTEGFGVENEPCQAGQRVIPSNDAMLDGAPCPHWHALTVGLASLSGTRLRDDTGIKNGTSWDCEDQTGATT